MDATVLKPQELVDLDIERLGPCNVDSPLDNEAYFIEDKERVLLYSDVEQYMYFERSGSDAPSFEKAGPRQKIFFDPANLNCGIVTCGGLCPGLNDVIRTITLSLMWQYRVKNIYGFKYGYAGLTSSAPAQPELLTPDSVDDIHLKGGGILSSSRGPQDSDEMVDTLISKNIRLLFVIGGDGTLRGASDLCKAIKRRKASIAVIGIPKTIDNDILGIEKSFGFSTAVEAARSAICGAHQEAKGAWNGVGLVKLMGRDSGFIAAYASLANSDVNFCFIPEVPLVLEGEDGFLNILEKRLFRKPHVVIVVAEGAGQDIMKKNHSVTLHDASGNVIQNDIGLYLKERIIRHFKEKRVPISLKYIDPSYIIRSVPADSNDSAFCLMLGQYAVHAGMSGRTNMVIGYWNQYFTHVPISLATLRRKKVDPNGQLWQTVMLTTGQRRNLIQE